MHNKRNPRFIHETNELLIEWISAEKIIDLPHKDNEQIVLEHYTLLLFVKGKGEFSVNGIPNKLSNNAIFLLPPHSKLEKGSTAGKLVDAYQVKFDLYKAQEKTAQQRVYERELNFPIHGLIARHTRAIRRLILLMAEQENSNERSNMLANQKHQLLVRLLELLLEGNSTKELEESSDYYIQQTVLYLIHHYHKDIKMEMLAEMAGMQASYYSQRFKQRMNKTPIEFLTELRMNKAKQLLLTSNYSSIREIARLAGYRDEYYFSRRFKEHVGCAPSYYVQQQHKPRIVCLSYPFNYHLKTLGVTPLAAQHPNPFAEEATTLHLPNHKSDTWEISRQIFLHAKPDFILCKDNVSEKAWEHLGDIAPIITITWKTHDVTGHLHQIAQLVNGEDKAQAWLENHEKLAKKGRKQIKESAKNGTVILCSFKDQAIRIYGARNIGHVFYRSLQLRPPKQIAAELEKYPMGTNFNWIAVSTEQLVEFEADFLFFVIKEPTEAELIIELLQNNPYWSQLAAVRNNKYYFLERDKWIIYAPASLDEQLKEAIELLSQ